MKAQKQQQQQETELQKVQLCTIDQTKSLYNSQSNSVHRLSHLVLSAKTTHSHIHSIYPQVACSALFCTLQFVVYANNLKLTLIGMSIYTYNIHIYINICMNTLIED